MDNKEVSPEICTSYDAIDELEDIRSILHQAQRKIYRNKLEKADIGIHIAITVEAGTQSKKI